MALRDLVDRVLRRRKSGDESQPQRPEGMPSPEEAAAAHEQRWDAIKEREERTERGEDDPGRYRHV